MSGGTTINMKPKIKIFIHYIIALFPIHLQEHLTNRPLNFAAQVTIAPTHDSYQNCHKRNIHLISCFILLHVAQSRVLGQG